MLPSRCLVLLLAGTLHAQSLPVEVANLREDVRGLAQRLGELALRIEQLERENAELRGQLAAAGRAQVTLAQLREGLAESAREARAAMADAPQAWADHMASIGRSLLPPAIRLYFIASESRDGQRPPGPSCPR